MTINQNVCSGPVSSENHPEQQKKLSQQQQIVSPQSKTENRQKSNDSGVGGSFPRKSCSVDQNNNQVKRHRSDPVKSKPVRPKSAPKETTVVMQITRADMTNESGPIKVPNGLKSKEKEKEKSSDDVEVEVEVRCRSPPLVPPSSVETNESKRSSTPLSLDSTDVTMDSWTTDTPDSTTKPNSSTPLNSVKSDKLPEKVNKVNPNSNNNNINNNKIVKKNGNGIIRDRLNGGTQPTLTKMITPYERVMLAMKTDRTWQKEIAYGRRIGLYRFRADIGTGNFSQVKLAMHTLTKEKVAIKILDKSRLDAKTLKMLSREIRTMETLHHPNLIRIFEVIESSSKHFIVMELAPAGELFQVITTNGRLSEPEAKFYFSQILSAIDHMHQHHLIHRDIKAENVFFSDAHTVKVGDFGFSTRITSGTQLLSTFCGSPPYAAPELFRDESYRGPYVDYWALGVLLYFMVTAQMPFKAQTIAALKKLILECRYDIPTYVSVECCQLIAGFLQPDPLKRYNLEHARATRWLRSRPPIRGMPKYDLKSSYAKIVKSRSIGVKGKPKLMRTLTTMTQRPLASSEETRTNRHSIHGDLLPNSASKSVMLHIDSSNVGSQHEVTLTEEERETFRQMAQLGIDESVLGLHMDKGSSSHVVGTFRILMNRVMKHAIETRRYQASRNNPPNRAIKRSSSMHVAALDQLLIKPVPINNNNNKNKNNNINNNNNQQQNLPQIPESKTKARLKRMFSNVTKPSIDSKAETVKDSRNETPGKKLTRHESKSAETPPVVPPVEEVESVKRAPVLQASRKVSPPIIPQLTLPSPPGVSKGDNGKLSRSLRALRHYFTESNLCGNVANHVTEFTTSNQYKSDNSNKMANGKRAHVLHRTTTMQIVPNSLAPPYALLWAHPSKLRRAQTTPDVSAQSQQQQQQPPTAPPRLYYNAWTRRVDSCHEPHSRANKKSFAAHHCTIV